MKYILVLVLLILLVVLGCATLRPGSCDATPTTSENVKCQGLVYPANAMDPCEILLDHWEVVDAFTDGQRILSALKNTTPGAKRTHALVSVVVGGGMTALCYLEEGQIVLLRYDSDSKQFVWDELSPQRYATLKRGFEEFFKGDAKVEPQKKRC